MTLGHIRHIDLSTLQNTFAHGNTEYDTLFPTSYILLILISYNIILSVKIMLNLSLNNFRMDYSLYTSVPNMDMAIWLILSSTDMVSLPAARFAYCFRDLLAQ